MHSKYSHVQYIFACMLDYGNSKRKILVLQKSEYQFGGQTLSGMNTVATEFDVSPKYSDATMVINNEETQEKIL